MKPRRTASSKSRRGPTLAGKSVTGSATDFMPPNPTVPKMRAAADGCRGCALYKCGHALRHSYFGRHSSTNVTRVFVVAETCDPLIASCEMATA